MTTAYIHTHAYLQQIAFEALSLAKEAGRDPQHHVPVAGVFTFFATEAWINHAIEQMRNSQTSPINRSKNSSSLIWSDGDDQIFIPNEFKAKGVKKTRQKLTCLWRVIEWSYRVSRKAAPTIPSFDAFEKLQEFRDTIGHPRNFTVCSPSTHFPEQDEFTERFTNYDDLKQIIQRNNQLLETTYFVLKNMPHAKRYSLRFEHPTFGFTREIR